MPEEQGPPEKTNRQNKNNKNNIEIRRVDLGWIDSCASKWRPIAYCCRQDSKQTQIFKIR
jgi:hypothetical protein